MPPGCVKCGGPLPIQIGRGRRRVKCERCAPSRKPSPAPVRALPTVATGLMEATRKELSAAGVEGSMLGQAALLLAGRIEFGGEPGSAVAQMVRQLRDTMAAALATEEPTAVDPVDEIGEARRRRRG